MTGTCARPSAGTATCWPALPRQLPAHPALPSEPIAAQRLYDYLTYRHRFRNLYSDALDWDLMRPLVMDMERTLAAFESDLDRFLTSNNQA